MQSLHSPYESSPAQASIPPHAASPQPAASPLRIERVGFETLEVIRALNRTIFEEERVINTFDQPDLLMLVAFVEGVPCGFKIGYRKGQHTFYSAKGGVLPSYRRRGIADLLTEAMIGHVRRTGFTRFAYDTFPNRHPGMAAKALRDGYRLVSAEFIKEMKDFRLSFEIQIA